MELADRIAFAKGEKEVDLLLTKAQLINVLSGRIETAQSVAIAQGEIVGLGEYPAKEILDLEGKFLAPGFIDAHVHIESSMVGGGEYARAVIPHGGTAVTEIRAADLKDLMKEEWVKGLGEMMNFPGVIHGDPEVLKKIEMAQGKRVDGHAPGLSGKELAVYIAAGISSDHE